MIEKEWIGIALPTKSQRVSPPTGSEWRYRDRGVPRTRDSGQGPGSRASLLPPPGDAGGELRQVLPGQACAVRGTLSRLAVLGALVPAGALTDLLSGLADLEKYVDTIKLPNVTRKTYVIGFLSSRVLSPFCLHHPTRPSVIVCL